VSRGSAVCSDPHRLIPKDYQRSRSYPSLEGLHSAQRLMAQQNPKIATLIVEDLVDTRFVRKLDESGFIDRPYAAQR
jgi:hypothetical protein